MKKLYFLLSLFVFFQAVGMEKCDALDAMAVKLTRYFSLTNTVFHSLSSAYMCEEDISALAVFMSKEDIQAMTELMKEEDDRVALADKLLHMNIPNTLILQRASDEKTALHCAVIAGKEKLVDLFLKNELLPLFINEVDSEGKTALHYAVETKNVSLVHTLLIHEANPSIQDKEKQTPLGRILHDAIDNTSMHTIESLFGKAKKGSWFITNPIIQLLCVYMDKSEIQDELSEGYSLLEHDVKEGNKQSYQTYVINELNVYAKKQLYTVLEQKREKAAEVMQAFDEKLTEKIIEDIKIKKDRLSKQEQVLNTLLQAEQSGVKKSMAKKGSMHNLLDRHHLDEEDYLEYRDRQPKTQQPDTGDGITVLAQNGVEDIIINNVDAKEEYEQLLLFRAKSTPTERIAKKYQQPSSLRKSDPGTAKSIVALPKLAKAKKIVPKKKVDKPIPSHNNTAHNETREESTLFVLGGITCHQTISFEDGKMTVTTVGPQTTHTTTIPIRTITQQVPGAMVNIPQQVPAAVITNNQQTVTGQKRQNPHQDTQEQSPSKKPNLRITQ